MKRKFSIILLIISILPMLQCSIKKHDENIGEWKYKILINGNKAGTAVVKISAIGDKYINELDMETVTGDIKNTSKRKLIETKEYKPVSLEILNKIINNNDIQEIKTDVLVNEEGVEVKTEMNGNFVKIEKPFRFDGLYNISELKKNKFKKGAIISSRIFDPQVESDSSVIMNTAVSDKKKFTFKGKEIELFHVLQYINNIKTIEMLMDTRGTIYKSKTTMLNYTMEMILE